MWRHSLVNSRSTVEQELRVKWLMWRSYYSSVTGTISMAWYLNRAKFKFNLTHRASREYQCISLACPDSGHAHHVLSKHYLIGLRVSSKHSEPELGVPGPMIDGMIVNKYPDSPSYLWELIVSISSPDINANTARSLKLIIKYMGNQRRGWGAAERPGWGEYPAPGLMTSCLPTQYNSKNYEVGAISPGS